ncbi:hypothetical protein AJ81_03895 [Pseudothermotoga hypogea DSM 11164 = NBRC 106472]|uniref:Uncharacterized protein n=2 Tax=Pseudothermotoga hypogea TaxID=57487 RepID=A0A0X1KTP2_9THEM|nr:hypothetical protein [Pseudothermotoga hypogea]AJC74697.1 hypothetical protein AJ81_03895 [Pseudothermotoga hypogea DSM 11164 = NBRC 106472]
MRSLNVLILVLVFVCSTFALVQDITRPVLSIAAGPVVSLVISPDSKYILVGTQDGNVKILDAQTNQQVGETIRCGATVYGLAIEASGKYFVTGLGDGSIIVWDFETRQKIRSWSAHNFTVRSVAISPDGKYIAAGSYDSTVSIWELETGELVQTLVGHKDWVHTVAFTPDRKYCLASLSSSGGWVRGLIFISTCVIIIAWKLCHSA